jgi:RimJ/RimL family protein N-acetyltransferase
MTATPSGTTRPGRVLTTARMRIVPTTAELVRAEIADHRELGRLLAARIPPDWPPEEAADALPWFLERLEAAAGRDTGWYGYYGVALEGVPDAPVLVGGGGTLGPPADGVVEIGYSLVPAFQGRGYATELVGAIVAWIAEDPRVSRITAETDAGNEPSRRLLARLGFVESGPGRDPGSRRYARELAAAS